MNKREAMVLLKKKGYKHTDKREDILDLFEQQDGYLSAKDIQSALKDNYPGISFDTIYRNLSLFQDLMILEETELDGEKIYQFHCTEHHHHHLICLRCGKTKTIDVCPMQDLSQIDPEFQVTGHKFEIYGYCKHCQDKLQDRDQMNKTHQSMTVIPSA
ncbi:Fur family transcriptional regulator [Sporolactobacillus kofuensis]|uniref:Fur family transcriptional regulator n=1 Tax=Sporolactobacillus kofuensis TaxID=269672 RepID=A0ABW1WH67_9BACL|nr:Fur family transcriptional regulator [Sporolactobacillus kofuensis]MCO7176239.1 transcriptional repressor [Sporolactobacillus kofuensis]